MTGQQPWVRIVAVAGFLANSLAVAAGVVTEATPFPTPTPAAAAAAPAGTEDPGLTKIRSIVKNQGDYVMRKVSRVGNQTLSMESFISTEGDLAFAKRIFSNPAAYQKWAMPNINVRTNGSYFVKVVDLLSDPKDPTLLTGVFFVDLPIIKIELRKSFRIVTEGDLHAVTITIDSQADDKSELGRTHGVVKIFPAEDQPGRLWLYAHTTVAIKHWLLYEALPEKVLNAESGERLQTILDNYQKEESRLRSEVSATAVEAQKKANRRR